MRLGTFPLSGSMVGVGGGGVNGLESWGTGIRNWTERGGDGREIGFMRRCWRVHKTVFWAEIGFMRKGRWKKMPWLKGLAKDNGCRMGLRGIGM